MIGCRGIGTIMALVGVCLCYFMLLFLYYINVDFVGPIESFVYILRDIDSFVRLWSYHGNGGRM